MLSGFLKIYVMQTATDNRNKYLTENSKLLQQINRKKQVLLHQMTKNTHFRNRWSFLYSFALDFRVSRYKIISKLQSMLLLAAIEK